MVTVNSTVLPILPAPLYIACLQRNLSDGISVTKNFNSKAHLDHQYKEELSCQMISFWFEQWKVNSNFTNQNLWFNQMPWFGSILPKSCDKEPKYLFVWNILTVLNFTKGVEDNEKFRIKLTRLKLSTPISLLSS